MTYEEKFPWWELKELEIELLTQLWNKSDSNDLMFEDLRFLLKKCEKDPDADFAICYHGAIALLNEYYGKWDVAAHHRNIEIDKIKYLHELVSKDEIDKSVLENYGIDDLNKRCEILKSVEAKL